MYFLLKIGIFNCYVSLSEDNNLSLVDSKKHGLVFVGDVLRTVPWDSSPSKTHHLGDYF